MSGGDRIAINLAKEWAASVGKVIIFTTQSGKQMFDNWISRDVSYVIVDKHLSKRRNLWAVVIFEARAFIKGVIGSLSEKVPSAPSIVYTPSHFWPDVIAAILVRRRIADAELIGTLYLFPPSPFSKGSPYKGLAFFNGLLFFLSQLGIAHLYRRFARMIWVTNDYDKDSMTKLLNSPKIPVIAIKGGIDWPEPPRSKDGERRFAGVFIGRLHPQKGIQELVSLWKLVVNQRPHLRLAIIGDGPMEDQLRAVIKQEDLTENVTLFGFQDGDAKYRVIRESQVVFYMSTLEIVAMAPIEAMALGLPCIALNIPGRTRYFPKGTLLAQRENLQSARDALFSLLDNPILYDKLSREAISLAQEWKWEYRRKTLVQEAQKLLNPE
jgi:glycosyltransferase involved in cell wall biosynthesis